VIGLDDPSLLARRELTEGKIENIYAESGFIVVPDAEFGKLENPVIETDVLAPRSQVENKQL
jgi:putative ABC transport system permease protein